MRKLWMAKRRERQHNKILRASTRIQRVRCLLWRTNFGWPFHVICTFLNRILYHFISFAFRSLSSEQRHIEFANDFPIFYSKNHRTTKGLIFFCQIMTFIFSSRILKMLLGWNEETKSQFIRMEKICTKFIGSTVDLNEFQAKFNEK